MTELERILTETLQSIEKDLRQKLVNHDTLLENCQRNCQQNHQQTLTTLNGKMASMQEQIIQQTEQLDQLTEQQQTSIQQLQCLSDVYKNLELLLAKLNSLLSGR